MRYNRWQVALVTLAASAGMIPMGDNARGLKSLAERLSRLPCRDRSRRSEPHAPGCRVEREWRT